MVAGTNTSTADAARAHADVRLLRPDDTLGTVLDHPAFAGFAAHLLPWDDRSYDRALPLRRIDSLLPYHDDVDPDTVVAGLNRIVEDVAAGRQVFHDSYSDAERQADPTKRHTGLFFFRGRPGAPFAVISPGGGFAYVGSVHEGFPYAQAISAQGYNAFVLKYRAGRGGQVATQDLAAAITYIRTHAAELGVSSEDYSLWGSSAGARMAALIGSHGVEAFGEQRTPRPAAVVMAYTGHSDVASNEPATFVIVGDRDAIASPASMKRRVDVLRRAGTPVSYRVVPGLGHGFGAGTGTRAEAWLVEAVRFWESHMRDANKGPSK